MQYLLPCRRLWDADSSSPCPLTLQPHEPSSSSSTAKTGSSHFSSATCLQHLPFRGWGQNGSCSSCSLNPTEHLIKKLWFLLFPLPTVLVFYQFFTLAQCIATKIHTPADRAGGRNEYTGTSWPGIDPWTAEQDNVQPLTCNIIPFLNTSFTSPHQPTTTTK